MSSEEVAERVRWARDVLARQEVSDQQYERNDEERAVTDIVERLRVMHSDLRQGAFYTQNEDPTWDVTPQAADEIERLRVFERELGEALRLINDLREMAAHQAQTIAEQEDHIDVQRAEIERLARLAGQASARADERAREVEQLRTRADNLSKDLSAKEAELHAALDLIDELRQALIWND